MYQSGFPDLYCTHPKYGIRWIEVKLPNMKGSVFTPAQLKEFPKLASHGTLIWIITAATNTEYRKLFIRDPVSGRLKDNWFEYMFIK